MRKAPLHFVSGFIVAAVLIGSTAFAASVSNSPDTGYVFCVNNKTKVLTFPNSLKCPPGSSPVEVAGVGMPSENSLPQTPSKSGGTISSSAASGDANCNYKYLIANPNEISNIVPKCSSSQLANLQKDMTRADSESTARIQELQKNPNANADAITKLIQEQKTNIQLMTAIVVAIQKKVAG